jgi:adenosylmethionine-8-amino-7-oxononanoate aminotransferase
MVRMAADTFEFSPPLIASREDIDRIFDTVQAVIRDKA